MIRKFKKHDLGDLLSVWASASEVAHPFLSRAFLALERDKISNVYLPNAETWVFEKGGRVVGFVSLLGNEVGGIFVDPKHHGTGIGRALMDKATEIHGELKVEVFKANDIGRAFYSRYGFELVEEKVHEETGLDLLRLRLAANKSFNRTPDGAG